MMLYTSEGKSDSSVNVKMIKKIDIDIGSWKLENSSHGEPKEGKIIWISKYHRF
jgi:hypothetical protein